MGKIISGSIDLSKVDKSKIKEAENGKKYLNFTMLISDERDKYGNDGAIIIPQSKEERERKDNKIYIGNCKIVFEKAAESSGSAKSNQDNNDDLPW